jgi:hypothetical protein
MRDMYMKEQEGMEKGWVGLESVTLGVSEIKLAGRSRLNSASLKKSPKNGGGRARGASVEFM